MVDDGNGSGEVVLSGGESASAHMHRVLSAAVEAHPGVFEAVDLGSVGRFRDSYPDLLPRFEAARAGSTSRCEIAADLVHESRSVLAWRTGTGEIPVRDHINRSSEPLAVESRALAGRSRLLPMVPVDGADLTGAALTAFARDLAARGSASVSVGEAVEWIVERAGADGLDLSGHRIVALGAAAELAPTRLWLQGGADVLWIDVTPPPAELLGSSTLSGRIHWVPTGADILGAPHRVKSTIEEFAGDEAVDIGLYAYAPGGAREWRLTGAMNAIIDSLPAGAVRSVAMLVSPTTCGVLTASELEGEARRRHDRARWQAVADRIGLLGRGGGHARNGDTCTNRGIVAIQGSSYQAAQYLGKLMAAEAWATGDPGRHVSVNTAGVSRTASVRHPVFDTAFGGARAFGVETFDPATTAALNGLLTLRDRLDPTSPANTDGADPMSMPERAGALTTTRVHGGIYELPYPIAPTLRIATTLGVARDPRRIAPLIRRR